MRTSIQPDMPPILQRKLARIEAEHGRPFWEVVRALAEQGETRVSVAAQLHYSDKNFLRLLKTHWAPKDLPWKYASAGNKHHNASLTAEDVRLIRQLRPRAGWAKDGELTLHEIGRKFDVSYSTVQAVVNYRTWRHVP
jgi:hypothetical protein